MKKDNETIKRLDRAAARIGLKGYEKVTLNGRQFEGFDRTFHMAPANKGTVRIKSFLGSADSAEGRRPLDAEVIMPPQRVEALFNKIKELQS